ncbi:BTB/POZ domain-containing protein KCTD6-like [Branchiostoma floridae x Branchiostoma japonicum]
MSSNNIVNLNVGGHIYTTTRSTLTSYDSVLSTMVSQAPLRRRAHGNSAALLDDQGRFFIDWDGTVFRHVLNFLRIGGLVLPDEFKEFDLLEMEAEYYGIQEMLDAVRFRMGALRS